MNKRCGCLWRLKFVWYLRFCLRSFPVYGWFEIDIIFNGMNWRAIHYVVIEWIFFYSLKKRATPNTYLNLTILWATRFIREKKNHAKIWNVSNLFIWNQQNKLSNWSILWIYIIFFFWYNNSFIFSLKGVCIAV